MCEIRTAPRNPLVCSLLSHHAAASGASCLSDMTVEEWTTRLAARRMPAHVVIYSGNVQRPGIPPVLQTNKTRRPHIDAEWHTQKRKASGPVESPIWWGEGGSGPHDFWAVLEFVPVGRFTMGSCWLGYLAPK